MYDQVSLVGWPECTHLAEYDMATKKTKQDESDPTPPLNPNLTTSMPGAVLDHDQARLKAREATARMNGRSVDAVTASAGAGLTGGDVMPVASTDTNS